MKVKYRRVIEYEGDAEAIEKDLLKRLVKEPYETTKYKIREIELTKEN